MGRRQPRPGAPARAIGRERLDELAADEEFLARLRAASASLEDYLTDERWYARKAGRTRPVDRLLLPEFGITAVLPQYSGGLGILAGDHLKAASDLGSR